MKLTIESPHLQTDEKLEKLIYHKLSHLGKMYDRIIDGTVIVSKTPGTNNQNCRLETQFSVPQKTIFASAEGETFEIALHKLVDGLEHQLRRYKEELKEPW